MRQPSLRRVIWVSGLAWIVSWFCLGLEIFYWQHVTKTLHLNPPKVPAGRRSPRPGLFLLSVMGGSAVAPAVFLVAVIAAWARQSGRLQPRHCGRSNLAGPV